MKIRLSLVSEYREVENIVLSAEFEVPENMESRLLPHTTDSVSFWYLQGQLEAALLAAWAQYLQSRTIR